MKLRMNLAILMLLTVATAFAQQTQSNSGGNNVQQQNVGAANVAQISDTSTVKAELQKSALEQKGYDDAMKDVQKQKDKEDSDKRKASADSLKKSQQSFVTYTAVERAQQQLIEKNAQADVKEATKIVLQLQKLEAKAAPLRSRLQQLNQRTAVVEKVSSSEQDK